VKWLVHNGTRTFWVDYNQAINVLINISLYKYSPVRSWEQNSWVLIFGHLLQNVSGSWFSCPFGSWEYRLINLKNYSKFQHYCYIKWQDLAALLLTRNIVEYIYLRYRFKSRTKSKVISSQSCLFHCRISGHWALCMFRSNYKGVTVNVPK
jgi:hypothetical protein